MLQKTKFSNRHFFNTLFIKGQPFEHCEITANNFNYFQKEILFKDNHKTANIKLKKF